MSAATPVFINNAGGTASSKGESLGEEVRAAFAAAGVEIDLHLIDPEKLRGAIRKVTAPIIVVGGGDGTLGCAARVLVERGDGTALGILPLGTRNHLARELGIPLDLPGAARVIADAETRRIDVAWAGGEMFINNASIGLYPAMVRLRDETLEHRKMAKWIAAIPASIATLRRLRHHRLRLSAPGRDKAIATPMLFVGNNHYEVEEGRPGQRAALDDGLLSVFAIGPSRRLALIGFAVRALFGQVHRDKDFAAIGDIAAFELSGHSHEVKVALDGEVKTLPLPLAFRSDPLALTVVAPPAGHA